MRQDGYWGIYMESRFTRSKGRRIRAKLDLLVTSGSLHVLKPLYIGEHAILQGVCLGFRNGPPPDVVVLGDCKAIR